MKELNTSYRFRYHLTIVSSLVMVSALLSKQSYAQINSSFNYPQFQNANGPRMESDVETAPQNVASSELTINTEYLARVAVNSDSTRLANFAKGSFLPSAIPISGEPFYGTGSRTTMQGSGSALNLSGHRTTTDDLRLDAVAQLAIVNANFPIGDNASGSVAVRQIFGRLNRLTVGVMDSAIADPSACPETIDLAGPSARVTAFEAGTGEGIARLSYDLFSTKPYGFKTAISIEQCVSKIPNIPDTDSVFSHLPSFVVAPQYVAGDFDSKGIFVEHWHLQLGAVLRDIAHETPAAIQQRTTAGGVSLSGAYRFANESFEPADRAVFSIAYGTGVSQYITDLNAAPIAGDAVFDLSGNLVTLPVLAWYLGYTHNWTDSLRSSVTYSQVDLGSTDLLGGGPSPYHFGSYLAVNLIHHVTFLQDTDDAKNQTLYTGVEFLYGNKETLDGSAGNAHRLMFVVAISK